MSATTPQFMNADERIFLIKFAWVARGNQIIATQKDMPFALKANDTGKGIEYIKEFDPKTAKFKTMSKPAILNLYTWETEAHEILTKHSYFGGKK